MPEGSFYDNSLIFCAMHSTNLSIASTDDQALCGEATRR